MSMFFFNVKKEQPKYAKIHIHEVIQHKSTYINSNVIAKLKKKNRMIYVYVKYCLYLIEPLLLQQFPLYLHQPKRRKPKTLSYAHINNIYIETI